MLLKELTSHDENTEGKSNQIMSQDTDEIEECNENQEVGKDDDILTLPSLEGHVKDRIEDTNQADVIKNDAAGTEDPKSMKEKIKMTQLAPTNLNLSKIKIQNAASSN